MYYELMTNVYLYARLLTLVVEIWPVHSPAFANIQHVKDS